MTQTPRLRFAPSPTGYLHIGGARTALFSWLYARKNKGTFVLRIEDTDRERSTEESTGSILEGLEWLGINWDEGPFHQRDRVDIYKSYIEKLLAAGKAYRCYCTPEELQVRKKELIAKGLKPKYDGRCRQADQGQKKPHCIRFLSPDEGRTTVQDLILGEVNFENSELDDLIIQRTDGSPTYNLCVVVDDALMRISHIIRGNDHLNNTPRQIQLYQACEFPLPQFVHLPLILGQDKSRLSKRHGATSVLAYRELGYLPEAMINFLARIGWSHGDDEIFSREELVEKFSLEHVGKSGGVFNQEKLLWLNAHYIKRSENERIAKLILPLLQKDYGDVVVDPSLLKAIYAVKQKEKTLTSLAHALNFVVADKIEIEPKLKEKFLTEEAISLLREIRSRLVQIEPFDGSTVKQGLEAMIAEKGLKLKHIAQPLRVSLTGSTVSPGIYELIEILGKKRVLQRLDLIGKI